MPSRRPIAVVVVAAALLGSGTPVLARGDERPPPSTSTTTTSTTLPTGIDVGHGGDQSGVNPLDDPATVEPADPDNVNEVLHISADEAQARRDAVRAELDQVLAHIARLEADVAAFDQLSADLVVQQRIVARRAVAARKQMVERAVGAYVAGNAPEIEAAYGATEPNEVEERRTIVSTIMEADRDEAERLLARRLDVTARLSRVLEQAEQTQAELRVVRTEMAPLRVRLKAANVTLQVLEAGSRDRHHRLRLPGGRSPHVLQHLRCTPLGRADPRGGGHLRAALDTAGGRGAGCHRQRRAPARSVAPSSGSSVRAGRSTTTPTSRPTPTA